MAVTPPKRAVMTLYSGNQNIDSHRVRIVIAEKGVNCEILDVDNNQQARQEMRELNPYDITPTLLDRDLILYHPEIIMEYFDERFPHPALLPAYPVQRARCRLNIYRMNKDWYDLVKIILGNGIDERFRKEARAELADSLTSVSREFDESAYFLSEDFSLLDCCLLPLLWRLPVLGIELPAQAAAIKTYSQRMFSRDSFVKSLTDAERSMRSG